MTTDNSTSASGAKSAAAQPKYNVQPYRPDGGFTGSGLIMLIGAMLIAGAAIGFVAHFVSQFFYLILLFPIGIGFLLGALGVRLVKFANLRNPLLGGLAGFIGGAAAMLMMHWFGYHSLREEVQREFPAIIEVANLPPDQREAAIQQSDDPEWLREAVAGVGSFPGYVDFVAREGVTITFGRGGGDGSGLNLGYVGSYIYWIVEMLIVAGITFAMVRGQTTEPFCTECSLWKPYRRLGALGGPAQPAIEGVVSGDLSAIAAAAPGALSSDLEMSLAECGNCRRADAQVKLEFLTTNKEGKLEKKVLAHTSWPAESVAALEALFAESPPPALEADVTASAAPSPSAASAPRQG